MRMSCLKGQSIGAETGAPRLNPTRDKPDSMLPATATADTSVNDYDNSVNVQHS